MRLIPHPSSTRFADYSNKVATDGFRKGGYACAIDVWIDHQLVFRTWDHLKGEPMLDWASRNYPNFAVPPFTESPFGCQKRVNNLDETLVPTRPALDRALSLNEIVSIMAATLAIARQSDDGTHEALPTPNTIRQRMHQRVEDWIVIDMHDHGIHVRTLIAQYQEPEEPMAEFRITVDAPDSSPVTPGVWHVNAPPVGTFEDGTRRRASVRACFAAAGLSAYRMTPTTIKTEYIRFRSPVVENVVVEQLRILDVNRRQGFFDIGQAR